ncbi:MAG: hypothetical protein EOR72_31885 [Mesorhizobium sp.]|uniref:hypothetical protein n=1 Tax=Mesorhizobium sp. TaxID=1871066 RepID=UPI000FE8FDFE|nr:hypothetical protein [Mesorhizobium sp.]RWM06301.1 MAG: hypothetical protein EOR72_31885 [Mesorhizobium sp.]
MAPPRSTTGTGAGCRPTALEGPAQPDVPIADDLPDIIGVVMEMGKTPQEQPAETSPLLFRPSRLPAHLDALAGG